MPEGSALVLGGGGVAGIAWITGLLTGLAEAGHDVTGAVIESRLPSHEWPSRRLVLVAVDAGSGADALFDAESGVSLVDAVAASSAVPGVWPPVTINGRRYVDGGVRSSDNADLAAGCARVLVISPLGADSPLPLRPLSEAVRELRAGGSQVTVISPDAASVATFGTNPLDPSSRVPAAEAGRAQGRAGRPAAG